MLYNNIIRGTACKPARQLGLIDLSCHCGFEQSSLDIMKGDCYICMQRKDVEACLTCKKEACINHFVPNINMCTKCATRFERATGQRWPDE